MKDDEIKKHNDGSEIDSGWDQQLRFLAPEVIASMSDAVSLGSASKEFCPRKEFAHLKDLHLDLNGLKLTDKQLIAVSLVFYGGVRKIRAAKAMRISSQAVADHIQAALKKISRNL